MESILLQAFLFGVLKPLVTVAGFLHVTTDHPWILSTLQVLN
jgi:hypothetical protein